MVVFFDGVCNLCQHSIRYLLKHDKKKILKFVNILIQKRINMILSKNDLCQVRGGVSSSKSPALPKKTESQSVDTSSLDSRLVTDPTKPVEQPKP